MKCLKLKTTEGIKIKIPLDNLQYPLSTGYDYTGNYHIVFNFQRSELKIFLEEEEYKKACKKISEFMK